VIIEDLDPERPRPVRFPPDALDYAQIAVRELQEPFTPDFVALVNDESPMNGCALVAFDHELLEVGKGCLVKVGRMDPVAALIAWKKEVDGKLVRMGLQYLE